MWGDHQLGVELVADGRQRPRDVGGGGRGGGRGMRAAVGRALPFRRRRGAVALPVGRYREVWGGMARCGNRRGAVALPVGR